MSTSPLPEDPYGALGVSKSATSEEIKKAHRKLVLKYHPDRIKDPALQEQGKNVFQKVQQAYELLIDPVRRNRYDNEVKLAELRQERMNNMNFDSSARSTFSTTTTTYTARPSPAPAAKTTTTRREMRSDGRFYEDRVPESYFEPRQAPRDRERERERERERDRDRFEEPLPRANARKVDSYETRKPSSSSSSKNSERKEKEKAKSAWDQPVKGMSMKTVFNLKKTASAARDRVRESEARAKARDKEEHRARAEKQSKGRYATVADGSDSDSDTVVPRRTPTKDPKSSPRARGSSSPESHRRRPQPPPRRRSFDNNEEHSSEDDLEKWERYHQSTREYIAESQKRPVMTRSGSSAHVYWEGPTSRDRPSGSDSDKRPSSSSKSSRRSAVGEGRPRPAMPSQNSAPGHLRSASYETRAPESRRATTNSTYASERRDVPLKRSETAPIPKSRKDGVPARGSNLKHGETMHDSGYGSSSSPHTPEMRGESPPPTPRESKRSQKSTKYQIVDPLSDDEERKPRLNKINREDDRTRRYRSPDAMDDRERKERDRPTMPRLDTTSRPRSGQSSFSPVDRPNMTRGESLRYDPSSPRSPVPPSRQNSSKASGEPGPDRDNYTRRVDPASIKFANYRNAPDFEDASPTGFRPSPMGSRRPSVFAT